MVVKLYRFVATFIECDLFTSSSLSNNTLLLESVIINSNFLDVTLNGLYCMVMLEEAGGAVEANSISFWQEEKITIIKRADKNLLVIPGIMLVFCLTSKEKLI
jgi:hypothetical protein